MILKVSASRFNTTQRVRPIEPSSRRRSKIIHIYSRKIQATSNVLKFSTKPTTEPRFSAIGGHLLDKSLRNGEIISLGSPSQMSLLAPLMLLRIFCLLHILLRSLRAIGDLV